MGNEQADRASRVEVKELAMGDLLPRADRCGVLSARARAALRRRLAGGQPYPALIVRPHPRRAGKYEVLDGHARAEVMRELGRPAARCEIWPASDEEAATLALSLNHLRGGADALRRAEAVGGIVRRLGERAAAEELGLTPAKLRQWLRPLAQADVQAGDQPGDQAGCEGPAPGRAGATPGSRRGGIVPVGRGGAAGMDFRPLVFHVTAAEAEAIESAIASSPAHAARRAAAARDTARAVRRGEALASAVAIPAGQGSPATGKSA